MDFSLWGKEPAVYQIRLYPGFEISIFADLTWGRPVDILVMGDGALLVSDDKTGVIYRSSFKKRVSAQVGKD